MQKPIEHLSGYGKLLREAQHLCGVFYEITINQEFHDSVTPPQPTFQDYEGTVKPRAPLDFDLDAYIRESLILVLDDDRTLAFQLGPGGKIVPTGPLSDPLR